jgi:two-component system cell cycle response regulator
MARADPMLDCRRPTPAQRLPNARRPPNNPSVNAADADEQINLRMLRTDNARMLLEQSGMLARTNGGSGRSNLQALIDALCELSGRDALTGLANRSHFNAVLEREIDRVARSGGLALLLRVEVDDLAAIGQAHGQPGADLAMRCAAKALQGCVRPMDTLSRSGFAGFALLMPDCEFHFGQLAAERLMAALGASSATLPTGASLALGASVGGAFAPPWIRSSAELWMERAEQQLYRARQEGGGRFRLEEQLLGAVTPEEKSLLFGLIDAAPVANRN